MMQYFAPDTIGGMAYFAPDTPPAASVGASMSGTTMTGSGTMTGGAATGAASVPGATMSGGGSVSGGAATGSSSGCASASGTTMTAGGTVTGGQGTGTANAPGGTMSGGGAVAGGNAVGDQPPLVINPRMLYVAGRHTSFPPMRVSEVEVLTIDFGPDLAPGETIIEAVWSNSVWHGTDANPNAMIQNRCTISGKKVSELFAARVPGVIYAPRCVVKTNFEQTLIQPEFDHGLLYVSP